MSRHLTPRRRFGQHFLVDAEAARSVVDAVSPRAGELVVEVGPGTGVLTRGLLRRFPRVVAVEIDRDLAAGLSQLPDPDGRLRIIAEDILRVDVPRLLREEDAHKLCVVGNLPYNISAPFLFLLRDHARMISSAVLTLQREVAQRIAAGPGSKQYGALTILLGLWCNAHIIQRLPPSAFRPRPKVHSCVLQLSFCDQPRFELHSEDLFARLVRAAFAQRRKMLRNALESWWSSFHLEQAPSLERIAERAGIDLSCRAEQLAPADFAAFSNELSGTFASLAATRPDATPKGDPRP